MRILQSSFFRALTAIAIGVMLVKYPDNTVVGIVIAIGILFLLSGLISVLSYVNARRSINEYTIYDSQGRQITGQMPMFPIVGIGSIVLGAFLALMPSTFIAFLLYVIGAILLLGAITQFMAIINVRRYGKISYGYWVCPSLILIAGIYLMLNPFESLGTTMYVLGWITLFYGVVEAFNNMVFFVIRRRWEKAQDALSQIEEAEEVEDGSKQKSSDDQTAATE